MKSKVTPIRPSKEAQHQHHQQREAILYLEGITHLQRVILFALHSFKNARDGRCNPGHIKLAKRAHCSMRRLQGNLYKLTRATDKRPALIAIDPGKGKESSEYFFLFSEPSASDAASDPEPDLPLTQSPVASDAASGLPLTQSPVASDAASDQTPFRTPNINSVKNSGEYNFFNNGEEGEWGRPTPNARFLVRQDFRSNVKLGFDRETALADALDVHHVSREQFEEWYPNERTS